MTDETSPTVSERIRGIVDRLQMRAVVDDARVLAANPPSGADAVAAWNALEARLSLRPHWNPVGAASNAVLGALDPARIGDAVAQLADSLARAFLRAVADGHNDPADPVILEGMFTRVACFTAGELLGYRYGCPDSVRNFMSNQFAPGFPADHPLMKLEMPRLPGIDGLRYVVLAPPNMTGKNERPWHRLSDVSRLTTLAIELGRRDELERAKIASAVGSQRLETARQLEAQAARLRGELV